jgi:hypothetical protein
MSHSRMTASFSPSTHVNREPRINFTSISGACLRARNEHFGPSLRPLPTDRWVPLGRPFHGLEFWGRVLVQDNLVGVNPFRLAAEAWPNPSVDRLQLTIAVVGIELSDGREGFVLLASFQNGRHSVEDFLVGPGSNCR